jgi:hypothetical protein
MALRPNGLCWDFCGAKTAPGAFFLPGHDNCAERYLNNVDGGKSVAERLFQAGYWPGGPKNLREDALAAGKDYEACGRKGLDGKPCLVIGRSRGIQVHRADDYQHSPD